MHGMHVAVRTVVSVLGQLLGEVSDGGALAVVQLLGPVDYGADTGVGKKLEQQRVGGDSVDDMRGVTLTATLTNSAKYPATNSAKTITLPKMVNNTDYEVGIEIVEADGPVEYAEAYDKALNAFKVRYYGSAKNVTVKLHVKGGLY